MKQSDKLKVLIDSIKTANELMRKQIEINGRAVELLGEFITEPESLGKAPYSDNVPILNGFNMVGQTIESEVKGEYQVIECGVVGKDGKVEPYIKPSSFCSTLDKYELKDETIKPKDMKVGEWYVDSDGWIYKFSHISSDNKIFTLKSCLTSSNDYYNYLCALCDVEFSKSIRKATQQEVLKYFPDELEVPTHGGNDAGHIASLTDLQLKKLIDIQL